MTEMTIEMVEARVALAAIELRQKANGPIEMKGEDLQRLFFAATEVLFDGKSDTGLSMDEAKSALWDFQMLSGILPITALDVIARHVYPAFVEKVEGWMIAGEWQ